MKLYLHVLACQTYLVNGDSPPCHWSLWSTLSLISQAVDCKPSMTSPSPATRNRRSNLMLLVVSRQATPVQVTSILIRNGVSVPSINSPSTVSRSALERPSKSEVSGKYSVSNNEMSDLRWGGQDTERWTHDFRMYHSHVCKDITCMSTFIIYTKVLAQMVVHGGGGWGWGVGWGASTRSLFLRRTYSLFSDTQPHPSVHSDPNRQSHQSKTSIRMTGTRPSTHDLEIYMTVHVSSRWAP